MLLILGANGGIGHGLLDCAIESGAYGKTVGVYRDTCDVSDAASVKGFFESIGGDEPLHVINATGHLANGTLHDTLDDPAETFDVNVRGNFHVAHCFAWAAKERPGSSLLLLSSVVARLGVYGASSYGMSKAAISGLVRSAAKDYATFNARINCVEMGYFDVGMIESIPDKHLSKIIMSIPQKRLGTVEELWELCDVMLTNTYMTGSTVTLSGGL